MPCVFAHVLHYPIWQRVNIPFVSEATECSNSPMALLALKLVRCQRCFPKKGRGWLLFRVVARAIFTSAYLKAGTKKQGEGCVRTGSSLWEWVLVWLLYHAPREPKPMV